MKTGIELIADERKRQFYEEGFGERHDAYNVPGNLALAGACYALNGATMCMHGRELSVEDYKKLSSPGYRWPFAEKWWKPTNHIRDLVKAGALIAAEIDRMQRVA